MDRASPLPPRINKKKGWENDQILSEIETQNRTRDQEKVPRQLFLRNLSSSLRLRVVQFFFIYLAVILFLYSRDENNGTGGVAGLEGTYPLQILAFAGAVLSISVASTCLDYALFYILEVVWTGHYDVVYYAYSLHGVLGHVMSLLIMINLLESMHVLQKLGSLHTFTTSCLVVALCHSLKELYLRRHHKSLLKVRLKQKLAQMEDWALILSSLELSTGDEGNGPITVFNPVLQHGLPPPVSFTSGSSPLGDGLELEQGLGVGHSISPSQAPRSLYKEESIGHEEDRGNVSFFCCNGVSSDDTSEGAPTVPTEDTAENVWELDKEDRSFWTQLQAIKNGHLKLSSRVGITTIRSRKEAEAFGNKLFMHLTNGNTRPFTAARIAEIMHGRHSPPDRLKYELLPRMCHPLTPDRYNAPSVESGGSQDIVGHALRLFRCNESSDPNTDSSYSSSSGDDGGSIFVTQSSVVNAVVTVFKEMQFSRASLQDLNQLHETAKAVIDSIFLLFMLLLVQVIMKVDISKVIAPLLTILFGLSFAFSPVLSNLFLSMAFVMFLLPFNVGNRVVIGKTEKIKGNVFEMSLMHTTILTRHNEKLRIPNHQLFHEHITNLSEGLVSTFEIPIVFALDGPLRCPQEKIHTFIRRVKQFAKVDHKEDWIDVIVFCDAMDYSVNQAKYTFWCTHRASYHEVIRAYNGHTRMLEEMRRLQVDLDIHLQKGLKLL